MDIVLYWRGLSDWDYKLLVYCVNYCICLMFTDGLNPGRSPEVTLKLMVRVHDPRVLHIIPPPHCTLESGLSSLRWIIAAFNSLQIRHSQFISFKLHPTMYKCLSVCGVLCCITARAPDYDNGVHTCVWNLEKQWKGKKGRQVEKHSSS